MVVGRHLRHSHLGGVFAWTPTIEGGDAGEQWSSRTRRGTVRPGSRRFNCCMGRDAIQHANRVFRERHAQARRGHAYREGGEVLLSSEHLSLRGEHPKFFPKFVGPFKIAALRGVNTVELSIPRRSQFGLIDTVVNLNRLRL